MMVLYEYGGLVLDPDILISKWSNQWFYSFDAIWIKDGETYLNTNIFNNDIMISRPKHPVIAKYIEIVKSQFEVPPSSQPIQQTRCLNQTTSRTPYEAGIYPAMVAWALESNRHGTTDLAAFPKNSNVTRIYKIKTSDTNFYEFEFNSTSMCLKSWSDQYLDALNFGFF